MKGRCITVFLMLLALVAVCIVSAPVLSSEHPWDADGGGQPNAPGASPPWELYWLYQLYYQATGQVYVPGSGG